MNRLRVLKQRANRCKIGITKCTDGYYVAHGYSMGAFSGDYRGPMSKREAILLASRWALPWKRHTVTISTTEKTEDGMEREKIIDQFETETNW